MVRVEIRQLQKASCPNCLEALHRPLRDIPCLHIRCAHLSNRESHNCVQRRRELKPSPKLPLRLGAAQHFGGILACLVSVHADCSLRSNWNKVSRRSTRIPPIHLKWYLALSVATTHAASKTRPMCLSSGIPSKHEIVSLVPGLKTGISEDVVSVKPVYVP